MTQFWHTLSWLDHDASFPRWTPWTSTDKPLVSHMVGWKYPVDPIAAPHYGRVDQCDKMHLKSSAMKGHPSKHYSGLGRLDLILWFHSFLTSLGDTRNYSKAHPTPSKPQRDILSIFQNNNRNRPKITVKFYAIMYAKVYTPQCSTLKEQ